MIALGVVVFKLIGEPMGLFAVGHWQESNLSIGLVGSDDLTRL